MIGVTGSTGFVGSRLTARYLSRGAAVRALVRARSARRDMSAPLEVAEIDLSSEAGLSSALRGVTALVHLAAAGVSRQDRTNDVLEDTNTLAPARLVRAAAAAGVEYMIFAGTCLEYQGFGELPDRPWSGTPAGPLCTERSPATPRDLYGRSKAEGGARARAEARRLGVDLSYLRFAAVFGPGDRPGKFIPAAIRAARAGEPFSMSPGQQVRDFISLDDAVDAIMAAEARRPAGVNTVNIGSGEGLQLGSLAAAIFRAAGRPLDMIRQGAREYASGEPHHIVLDSRLAGDLLDWRASPNMAAQIEQLVRSPEPAS